MKRHRCLKETINHLTYNLVRKNLYAVCACCAWRRNFWRSCYETHMYMDEGTGRVKNHSNWKLVSKNSKQWMMKRFVKVKRP
jgi:hypothetical protein